MMMTKDELVMLRHLAESQGLTSSDVLRTLMRAAFKKSIGAKNEAEMVEYLRDVQPSPYRHK